MFLLLFITTSTAITAQKQTTVYCKITIFDLVTWNGKPKSTQVDIDYGTMASSLTSDTVAIASLKKVKTMTNGIDAMNYMNSIGWELVIITTKGNPYECFYKKEFDK